MRVLAILAILLAVSMPALAAPRYSGRIIKILPGQKLVVFQRSDGKQLRAVMRADAVSKRLGVDAPLGTFRVGDYIVVEIGGPLNDNPLDGIAIMDQNTAALNPSRTNSAPYHTESGGFPTAGGPAASNPYTLPETAAIAIGGPQQAGVYHNPHGNPQHAPAQHNPAAQPQVGAYGPTNAAGVQTIQVVAPQPQAPQNQIPPATGGAAPSPAGSPYTGQVIAGGGAPQAQPNVVTPPPAPQPYPQPQVYQQPQAYPQQQPQQAPAPNPTSLITGEDTPQGVSNPSMANVVSYQGNVTQVMVERRLVYVQAMVQGQPGMVAVYVPQPVRIISSKTQQSMDFGNIKVGDFLMLQGLQAQGGTVEARQIFVNQ